MRIATLSDLPAYRDLRSKFSAVLARLSWRERSLLGAAVGVAFLLFAYNAAINTKAEFSALALKISQAEADAAQVKSSLERYMELKNKSDEIRRIYKSVEIEEGELSYLEKLIKEKAGIAPNIVTPAERDFGSEYIQKPFVIKFSTTDFKGFVEFLKALVEGPKPFILSRLDLTRRRGADRLEVDMEASSLRHKK